jgi:2-dehydropantoate 2-reductase
VKFTLIKAQCSLQIEEDVARLTAENRSSMLQDLDRGRRTEINEINGVVTAFGEKYSVKCEVNETLLCLVGVMELRAQ